VGEARHVPVLVEEVLNLLAPRPGGRYLDLTFGGGGHARKVLEREPECRVVGVDRDGSTLQAAARGLAEFGERLSTVHSRFDQAAVAAAAQGIGSIDGAFDGVLADLGLSSLQLDDPERGLSFERDAVLDMRMDRGVGETAAGLLGRISEQELADLLFRLGDEGRARSIARAIVERRRHAPVRRTLELADLVVRATGGRLHGRIHPATRTFQALRMAVNDEIGCLERVLSQAPRWLKAGGTLVVISFHSGEDRVVKRSLRAAADQGLLELVNRKVIEPGAAEVACNPRARSARLRAARRVGGNGEANDTTNG
jgi:16S rRNA (cytosine1402-N4)-methyltransferase